jgi:hypothetical protein
VNTLVKAEIWTVARTEQGNAVLVRPIGSELAIPIFIGQLETQAILIGFGGVPMPRPLTHDLILNLLRRFEAELLRVEINELHDGTFYSRIILGHNGDEIVIDARPSDAVALAVRKKCPVFIAESVVEAAGISVDLIVDADKSHPAKESNLSTELDARATLIAELDRAIESEEYEHAAALRDILKSMEP